MLGLIYKTPRRNIEMVQTATILPFKRRNNIYRDRFLEPPDQKISLIKLTSFKMIFESKQAHIKYLERLSFEDLRTYYHLNKNNPTTIYYVRGLGLI